MGSTRTGRGRSLPCVLSTRTREYDPSLPFSTCSSPPPWQPLPPRRSPCLRWGDLPSLPFTSVSTQDTLSPLVCLGFDTGNLPFPPFISVSSQATLSPSFASISRRETLPFLPFISVRNPPLPTVHFF